MSAKGLRYWITAMVVLALGTAAAPYVYNRLGLSQTRAWLFQQLLAYPSPPQPRFVKVILIEDDEYLDGYLAGRRPIKRDYLAQLVDKLVSANAHVIALDFDLQIPDPDRSPPEVPSDYRSETNALVYSVINAAENGKKVVLPRTIGRRNETGYYLEPDIFQPYGICTRIGDRGQWLNPGTPKFPISDGASENITCGYIALPKDILRIPGRLRLDDGSYIDSFALAVVRAANPEIAKRISSQPAYGNHISDAEFSEYDASLSAHRVLNAAPHDIQTKLDAQTVIIGGHWSTYAFGRGRPVDIHASPIGYTVGANLHANFVEAFLSGRTFSGLPGWFVRVCEILFSLLAMIVFAAAKNFVQQIAGIVTFTIALIGIQWLSLHLLGFFFDAFVPLVSLWLHSVYERLLA